MKLERFFAILFIVFVGTFLTGKTASSRSAESPRPADGFNCSPAPCVLPPTQASEGGGTVTDTPIVTNPLDRKELLLGSVDYNCGQESSLGFHLSTDGGSTWERVECMPAITAKQNNYLPLDEPSVGYDRSGTAYIAGVYFNVEGYGDQGLVAVQKSTDGTHWSKPVVALRHPGQTYPFETRLTVDTKPGSPWANSLYISGVIELAHGKRFWSHTPLTGALLGRKPPLTPCKNTPKKTTLRVWPSVRMARFT